MRFEVNLQEASLEDAKSWLRKRVKQGARCPCCNQFTKIYTRQLYSSIVAALIHLYRKYPHNKFIHKSDLVVSSGSLAGTFGGGDFAKLTYWGLIEEMKQHDNPDKRVSGYWRITQRGIDFVEGRLKVRGRVRIYDGKFLGYDGEDVTIQECLKEKFSYSDLMSG